MEEEEGHTQAPKMQVILLAALNFYHVMPQGGMKIYRCEP